MAKNDTAMTQEEKDLRAKLAQINAEKRKAKEAKVEREAEQQALAIPTVATEQEIVYINSAELIDWDENPAPSDRGNDMDADTLRESLIVDGVVNWTPDHPAIIWPDKRTIQGNRRRRILAEAGVAGPVPCIVYEGDLAGALLLALNDTGTGIVVKGLGDVTRTVVNLMLANGLSARTVVRYLWRRAREILYRLSPKSKNAKTLDKAYDNAYGKMQNVAKYKQIPEDIREDIYAELNADPGKGKMFPQSVVNDLIKCNGDREAMDKVIADRKAQLEAEADADADDSPPNYVKAKDVVEMQNTANSQTIRKLAALLKKPAKDDADAQARDALAELRELDAELATAGQ